MKTLVYINDLTFEDFDKVTVYKNCKSKIIEGNTLQDIDENCDKLLWGNKMESYLIPELFKGEITYLK